MAHLEKTKDCRLIFRKDLFSVPEPRICSGIASESAFAQIFLVRL